MLAFLRGFSLGLLRSVFCKGSLLAFIEERVLSIKIDLVWQAITYCKAFLLSLNNTSFNVVMCLGKRQQRFTFRNAN